MAFTGEQFPDRRGGLDAEGGPAEVELSGGRAHAGEDAGVSSPPGENPMRLHASLNTPGALDLSVAIRAQASGRSAFRSGGDAAASQGAVCHGRCGQREFASDRRRSTAAQFDVQRAADFTAPAICPNINW